MLAGTPEQRRTRELAALAAVLAAISEAPTEKEALSQALKQVLPVLNLDSGRIYLWDAASEHLVLAAAEGEAGAPDSTESTLAPGECLIGDSCAAVPLLAGERALGVLHVAGQSAGPFSDGDVALLRAVAAQMGIALENLRLREEAHRAGALTTLIQEMHHRIKNNLQTVADLLSLEMSASPSPAARKSLRDSISRIKSIAVVHQLLSVEQMRLTDITELTRQVCDISLHHFVRPDQQVHAEIDGPPIYLPSKQATALALVMNELLSNALEHAFSSSKRRGLLTIRLASEGPQVTVTVSDDGQGLPPDFDLDRMGGLGLQIVRTLVEKDLAGTLQLESRPNGGSQVTLIFYK